ATIYRSTTSAKHLVRHAVDDALRYRVLTCRVKQDTFLSLVEDSTVDNVGLNTSDRDGVSLAVFTDDLVSVTGCGCRRESHLTANASKVWETVTVSWGVFGDHPHVLLDLAVVRLKQDYSFTGLVSIIEHLRMGADGRTWAHIRVGAYTRARIPTCCQALVSLV